MSQDDLAATATYDAVFFEDPSLEAEDYFSDWDDLSDDYYDEDPTVKRRQRMAGLANRKSSGQGPQTIRGRKRSNDAQIGGKDTARVVSSLVPDPASFQSVIWKRPDHDHNPVQIMVPGEGEKVALLKNWREVFKNSHPSFGRSRMRRQQKVLDYLNNSDMEPAPSGPVNDLIEDEMERDVSTDRTSGDTSLDNLRAADGGAGDYASNTTLEKSVSPPSVHEDKAAKSASVNDLPVDNDPSPSAPPPSASSPAKGRKRKASISIDEGQGQNGYAPDDTQGRKPKRVAAKKVGQEMQPTPKSGPVRRSARQTRSQK